MQIEHILKRDGRVVGFDAGKIARPSRRRAGAPESWSRMPRALAATVAEALTRDGNVCPGVETIQNHVEEALVRAGHWRTARAYIVHREQHARLRSLRHTLVDVESAMEEYLEQRDWRVNANANQGYSLGGLILNVAGKVTANYWLSNVFTPEAGQAHRDGDIHIHDLDMLSGYCAGWSLRQLLTEGFNGITGKVEATPPRHMSAAIGQIVNFLGTLQNEWAGAQAFSSFDTYMAPFIRRDAMTYADVKQAMQGLIYNLNVPSRWGTQTPFTNLTFDWACPADLREQIPYIGGEEMPFAYGDLQAEMDMINRAYIEVMMAGDAKGRAFTFPIPTYNITPDFDWDHPNTTRLFEMTARYGLFPELPELGPGAAHGALHAAACSWTCASCSAARQRSVRLGRTDRLGRRGDGELRAPGPSAPGRRGRPDGAAGPPAGTGPRRAGDQAQGGAALHRPGPVSLYPALPGHAAQPLQHAGRERHQRDGPQLQRRRRRPDHARRPRAGAAPAGPGARARMTEFQEQTGHLYNLEATPAEGTTYRFAREDRKRYPGILQAGTEAQPYYTNSSQLPVGHTDDPFQALAQQERCRASTPAAPCCTLYMNEAVSSAEACKTLVRRALANFRLPYITVTPTFSICPTHGYLAGRHVLPQVRRRTAGPAIGLPRPGLAQCTHRRAARPTSHQKETPPCKP